MLFGVPMPILPPGRRPLSPGSRAGLGAAFGLLLVITTVEIADGPRANYIGLFVAVPFLAAVFAYWQTVLVIGLLATVIGLIFVTTDKHSGMIGMINVVGIVLATGIAASVATVRQRQADRIAQLVRLAAVAQQAVLRPLGPQLGSLSVAARYI